MRLDPARPDDVRAVAERMRPRDRMEFEAVFGNDADLPTILAERYGERADCLTAWAEDEPVAVAGFLEMRPHVVTLLMFATPEISRIGLAFTRKARSMMANMEAAGVHRFECMSIAGYGSMHRWLATIGMQIEGWHHGWGANGEKFASYARVK